MVRIIDHPDMTPAVNRGRKALSQTNQTNKHIFGSVIFKRATGSLSSEIIGFFLNVCHFIYSKEIYKSSDFL